MEDLNSEIGEKVKALQDEHQALEEQIKKISEDNLNNLEIQRLKKRKLFIKDQITNLTKYLNPDIIA